MLHGLLNLIPYLQSEVGNNLKNFTNAIYMFIYNPLNERMNKNYVQYDG